MHLHLSLLPPHPGPYLRCYYWVILSLVTLPSIPPPSPPLPPRAPFEVLLRRLMQMDSKPAVVVLNGYRMSDRKNPEGGTRGVEGRTGQD